MCNIINVRYSDRQIKKPTKYQDMYANYVTDLYGRFNFITNSITQIIGLCGLANSKLVSFRT